MKKLEPFRVDDYSIIKTIANNSIFKKTSYPYLKNELSTIIAQYNSYEKNKGDPCVLKSIKVSKKLKVALLKHYNSPPDALNFIRDVRNSSPDVCPVCGSERASNLDHFMPKEDYPEWSFFSKNLVPACTCNFSKGTKLIDPNNNKRRLFNPYYADFFKKRLVTCKITSNDNFKYVTINYEILNNNSITEDISYHIEVIFKSSGILSFLYNAWTKLRKSPLNEIQTIPREQIQSEAKLKFYIEDAIQRYDKSLGTPNNWRSIFCHSIIYSDGVLAWLLDRHNGIQSGLIDVHEDQ